MSVASNGTKTFNFTAQSSSTTIYFRNNGSDPRDFYLDNTLVADSSSAGTYAVRLNGSTNEKYGLARSLSVMPGDTIKMEVFAKYIDTNPANWTPFLNELINQVAGGTLTATRIDGGSYLEDFNRVVK